VKFSLEFDQPPALVVAFGFMEDISPRAPSSLGVVCAQPPVEAIPQTADIAHRPPVKNARYCGRRKLDHLDTGTRRGRQITGHCGGATLVFEAGDRQRAVCPQPVEYFGNLFEEQLECLAISCEAAQPHCWDVDNNNGLADMSLIERARSGPQSLNRRLLSNHMGLELTRCRDHCLLSRPGLAVEHRSDHAEGESG